MCVPEISAENRESQKNGRKVAPRLEFISLVIYTIFFNSWACADASLLEDREEQIPLTSFTPQKNYTPADCVPVTSSERLRDDSGSSSRKLENSASSEADYGGTIENVCNI